MKQHTSGKTEVASKQEKTKTYVRQKPQSHSPEQKKTYSIDTRRPKTSDSQ